MKLLKYLCSLSIICCSNLFADPDPIAPEATIPTWQIRLEHAEVLTYLKRYDEALEDYLKVLAEHPDEVKAHVGIASIYYYQKKYNEALQELEKIPSDKKTDQAQVLYADIYMAQKKYSQADEIYRAQLKKFPEDDNIRLKLAEMLTWQKKYGEAIAMFKYILAKQPDNITVRVKYAKALSAMGKHAEAEKELRGVLKE